MGVAPWVSRYPRNEAVALYEALASMPPDERTTLLLFLKLTPRQQQVAMLTAKGVKRGEIADQFCIDVSTVRIYLNRIYRAYGIEGPCTRIKLAQAFMRLGRALG